MDKMDAVAYLEQASEDLRPETALAQAIRSVIDSNKELSKEMTDFRDCWLHKDKIRKKLEELETMKVDGEVFTTAVEFTKKILQDLLEK